MAVDVTEIMALAVDLGKAGGGVGAKAAMVVRKTAADIERTAKQLAPVDTGALRNSISHEVSTGGGMTAWTTTAEIGPTVNYGAHQEYGTSRTQPQPFMRPAVELHTPTFIAALDKVIEAGF